MFETGFETSVVPGWHTTIYPFYYIIGLIFSSLVLVMFVAALIVKLFRIEDQNYQSAFNWLNLIGCILGILLILIYGYELFMAWYSGYFMEQWSFYDRALGPYFYSYFIVLWLPLLANLLFLKKKNRISANRTLFITLLLNIGFWFERGAVFFTSLFRDFF